MTTKADTESAAGTLAGPDHFGPPAAGLLFLMLALWLLAFTRGSSALRPKRRWVLAVAVLFLFLIVPGCGTDGGGGNNNPTVTPKGTHTITVNASSGTILVPLTVTLVVN